MTLNEATLNLIKKNNLTSKNIYMWNRIGVTSDEKKYIDDLYERLPIEEFLMTDNIEVIGCNMILNEDISISIKAIL